MVQKLKSLRVDLIIITVILIAGLIFTFGIEKLLDISLYDESDYLYRGVTLWNAGFPPAELAPLYSIWYFIISFLEPNRVMLYFLNYKLMMILPPIFVYALLRKNTVSIPISLTISSLLLVSHANTYIGWRVSYFGLIVLLATCILISHKKSLLLNSLFASLGALLVSYVRPEYFLTYILSTLLFIFLFVREYNKLEKQYLLGLLAVYGLYSALLLGTLGVPIAGSRSFGAFAQHFSMNWVSWTGSTINPGTNWWDIIALNFGSAHSIPEALAKNPSAFLLHITDNLRNLAPTTAHLIFPVNFFLSRRVAILLIVGLLITYVVNTRSKRLLILVEYKSLLIFFGLFALPGLVSITIIYPENHYILLPGVLTIVLMAILLTNHDFAECRINFFTFGCNVNLPIGIRSKPTHVLMRETGGKQEQMGYKQLLLISLFVIALTLYVSQNREKTQQPTLNTIRFIQSLGIHKPVNLLEAEGGYNIYLGDNFHRVAEYDKSVGFNHFRADQNINMIVVSYTLLNDTRFINDPEWQGFLTDYRQLGYIQQKIYKQKIYNTGMNLILSADLLQK
jgi:hypothetical protein